MFPSNDSIFRAASRRIPSIRWLYVSIVSAMLECPRRSCTTLGCSPSRRSIEGELPEDGLAALEVDGQGVFLALARRLTNQAPSDGASLEARFAETRTAEAEAEGFLVDDTWQPERADHVLPAV